MFMQNMPVVYWFQTINEIDAMALSTHYKSLQNAGFRINSLLSLGELYQKVALMQSAQSTLEKRVVFVLVGLGSDSLSALARLRSQYSYLPLLIVLPDFNEQAISQALYCGADDYCLLPYGSELWIAKIENILRRTQAFEGLKTAATVSQPASIPQPEPVLIRPVEEAWHLSEDCWLLIGPNNVSIALTTIERALLVALYKSVDRQATHEQLLDAISDESVAQEGAVAYNRLGVVVSRLKRKGQEKGVSVPIRSVYKWGYAFSAVLTIS